jgi:hypothetical protein
MTGLGRRLGAAALGIMIGLALISEREATNHYIDGTYTLGVLAGGLAPIIDQPVGEEYLAIDQVQFDAPCPAQAFALTFRDAPPLSIPVIAETPQQAAYLGMIGPIAIYTLPTPVAGSLILEPVTQIGYTPNRDNTSVSVSGLPGDPVARLYCAVENPQEVRFKQLYEPNHPNLSRSALRAWPTVWYWIGWITLAASIAGGAWLAYDYLRKRPLI